MKKIWKMERGFNELYAADPERADWEIWGRIVQPHTRRGFLKKSGLLAMAWAVGGNIPFADKMPSGLMPVSLANAAEPFIIPGKHPEMVILNDKPLNMEARAHLLDDEITPWDKMFVRNNGIPPVNPDAATWILTIDGESVKRQVTFTLKELKEKFKHHTYHLQLECGGNGRSEYYPPAKGNQWTVGAVSCAMWTGVRLKDVLEHVGLKDDAVYIGYYGKDTHLSGDPNKVVISRGVPIAKALEDESLLAFQLNGEDIPLLHGYPLRLLTSGWPASTSGKWVHKIVVRNKVHDGPKMGGTAYRIPCQPVAPGAKVSDEDMCIIESMPVKSLITYPKSGIKIQASTPHEIRGHAWAGDLRVSQVDISFDFGATWSKCELQPPKNRLGWQNWSGKVLLPQKGYYEIWARATDSQGRSQPVVVPGWNPKGYLNNACHRIAVKAV